MSIRKRETEKRREECFYRRVKISMALVDSVEEQTLLAPHCPKPPLTLSKSMAWSNFLPQSLKIVVLNQEQQPNSEKLQTSRKMRHCKSKNYKNTPRKVSYFHTHLSSPHSIYHGEIPLNTLGELIINQMTCIICYNSLFSVWTACYLDIVQFTCFNEFMPF